MKTRIFCFLWILWEATPLMAKVNQACPPIKSEEAIIRCVLSNAPEIQDASLHIEELRQMVKSKDQAVNPRMEIVSTGFDVSRDTFKFSYYHTLELGGKRQNRKNLALSQVAIAEEQINLTGQQLTLKTKADLLRLRQIQSELVVLAESTNRFNDVITRLKNARGLSPEQESSLLAFQLARQEILLHHQSLLNEKDDLHSRLELRTGKNLEGIESFLTPMRFIWPKLPENKLNPSSIKIAEAVIESAQAEITVQQGLGTSNLEIGPRILLKQGFVGQTAQLGFGVYMPMSLYNRNQGGVAWAEASLERASAQRNQVSKAVEKERVRQSKIYRSSVQVFESLVEQKQLSKKHAQLKHFIERGVVNAAIVIEVHRQILAYQQQLHRLEQAGKNAFWRIEFLEGKKLLWRAP